MRSQWPFVVVLILAAGLRANGLNDRAFWFDEAIEYWITTAPYSEIHAAVAIATHDPPLFNYLLKVWSAIGHDEFWLRLPALFFSLLGISGTIALGRIVGGRRTAVIAGLVMAVSAADIRYAQESGQYAMLVGLSAWSTLFLLRGAKGGRWADWITWGFLSMVGLYTHYGFAILTVMLSAAVWPYLLMRNRPIARQHLLVGGVVFLSGLPLLFGLIPQQLDRLVRQALPTGITDFGRITALIGRFFLLSNDAVSLWPWPSLPPWLLTLLLILLLSTAVFRVKTAIDPLPLLAFTLVGYFLIGRSGVYFFVPGRHALFLLPLFAVVLSQGVETLDNLPGRWRWVSWVAVGLLCIVSLAAPRDGQEDLRSAVSYWIINDGPTQPTFVYYGAVPAFRYQANLQTGSMDSGWGWYPNCLGSEEHPNCRQQSIVYSRWLRGGKQDELVEAAIGSWSAPPATLWLVFSHVHPGEDDALKEALSESYKIVEQEVYEGAAVMRLERRD